jgi:hypothetical protein
VSVDATSGLAATIARIREIEASIAGGAPAAPPPATAFASTLDQALGTGGTASAQSLPAATPVAATGASTVTGAQLDDWMRRTTPGSPLVGMGDVFVSEGRRNGIDPRALVAIAKAESALGSDPGARARNNAFGWGPFQTFGSWQENIATVAAGLRKGYLDDGLVTLADIQRRYAPVGAGNDPSNLNTNWIRNTTATYAALGGDPDGSVALG